MAVYLPIISEFNGKGIAKAKREFKSLEGAGAKAGYLLKKAFLPATAAIAGMAAVGWDAIKAASNLSEAQNKTNVIMGDAARLVETFADKAAKSFGLSRQAVFDAAGTFAVFGKSAGLTGVKLGDFTTKLTGLASDLASFNNSSPQEAITAIGAALRGESEPIRRFGVLLDDATLRAEALTLGLVNSTKKALTPQQKVLAAYSQILKQTSDAQGDFARTSDGLANRQRILEAQFANVKVALGEALIPAFEALMPYFEDLATWLENNPDKVANVARNIGTLAEKFADLVGWIMNIPEMFGAAVDWVVEKMENLVNSTISLINILIRSLNKLPFVNISEIDYVDFNPKPNTPQNTPFGNMVQNRRTQANAAAARRMLPPGIQGPVLPSGGNNVTVNVNGGDPRAVVDAIVRWSRQNGRLPAQIQTAG